TDVSSGLNISVDGGRTWTPSNTGIDVRGGPSLDGYPVFSLTIDPHNNDVVWAGTQSRMGIFKSTDGGRTWVRKSNGVAGDIGVTFRGFTVDPLNSDIVYAAGEIGSVAWNNGVPLSGRGFELTTGNGLQDDRRWRALDPDLARRQPGPLRLDRSRESEPSLRVHGVLRSRGCTIQPGRQPRGWRRHPEEHRWRADLAGSQSDERARQSLRWVVVHAPDQPEHPRGGD